MIRTVRRVSLTSQAYMLLVVILVSLVCLMPTLTLASTKTWLPSTTGTFSWTTGANWSGSTVPITGDLVIIDPAAAQTISNLPTITLGGLTIGGANNQAITFSTVTATLMVSGVASLSTSVNFATGITVSYLSNATQTGGLVQYRSAVSCNGNFNVTGSSTQLDFLGNNLNFSGTGVLNVTNGARLINSSSGTAIINISTVNISTNGNYRHNRNGGVIPTATWGTGSLCEIIGITNLAPTGISQSFFDLTWASSQSANINLNIGDGFQVRDDFSITRTTNSNTAANGINGNSAIGFALTLYSSAEAVDRVFSIGKNFNVIAPNAASSNVFLVLNAASGTNRITFNIGGNFSFRGDLNQTFSPRILQSIATKPCTVNVAGSYFQGARSEYHILDPGTAVGCVGTLSIAGDAYVGTAAVADNANNNALLAGIWWSSAFASSNNNNATLLVGNNSTAGRLIQATCGGYFGIIGGNTANTGNTVRFTTYGDVLLNGIGINTTNTPRPALAGYYTTNTVNSANITFEALAVNGRGGNFLHASSGAFLPFFANGATRFAGSSSAFVLNLAGELLASTSSEHNYLYTSGTGNSFTATVGGSISYQNAVARFISSNGNNNTSTISAAGLNIISGTTTFSDIGSTASGCSLVVASSKPLTIGGGTVNFQNNTSTATTNVLDVTTAGLIQSGGIFNMYPSTVASLPATLKLNGNVRLSNGTLQSAASVPVGTRRGQLLFASGSNLLTIASAGFVYNSFVDIAIANGTSTRLATSSRLSGNLINEGSLLWPTGNSPALLTITGNVTGNGLLNMSGAAHQLTVQGPGPHSFDTIINSGTGSTVCYNSSLPQTLAGANYERLILTGAGAKTLGSSAIVASDFIIQSGGNLTLSATGSKLVLNGVVTTNTSSIIAGAGVADSIIVNGPVQTATFDLGTAAIAHVLRFNNDLYGATINATSNTLGTVIFGENGNQSIPGGTYNNLVIDGSGVKTTNGSTIIVNTLLTFRGGQLLANLENDPSVSAGSSGLRITSGGTIVMDGGICGINPRVVGTNGFYNLIYNQSVTSGYEINPAAGALATLTVNGTLTLGNNIAVGDAANNGTIVLGTAGRIRLGNRNLTYTSSIAPAITGTFGQTNAYIETNGIGNLIFNLGTTRANYNFTYPLFAGFYSPLTINSTAGTVSASGLTMRAIANRPAATSTNAGALHYLLSTAGAWTGMTGTIAISYNTAVVTGAQANYVMRQYNLTSGGGWQTLAGTNAGSAPLFTHTASISTSFVASANYILAIGESGAFPATIYYSRQSGNWSASSSWSTVSHAGVTATVPPLGAVVVIGAGHFITADVNGINLGQANIVTNGTLDLMETTSQNLGEVSGDGTLRFTANTSEPFWPAGDFARFLGSGSNSTVSYAGSGSYNLPTAITGYNNLTITGGGTKQGPATAININGILTLGSATITTTFAATGDLYFTNGGTVINVPNGNFASLNHLSGTAFFTGNGIQNVVAGNNGQLFFMRNIDIAAQSILRLTGGSSNNQFNIQGNVRVASTSSVGFQTDANFSLVTFIANSTVSAPNGSTLGFTSVSIASNVTVSNSANWSLRRDILNNGTLNNTAGTLYWGCPTCVSGTIYSTTGTATTTFNNVEQTINTFMANWSMSFAVNGTYSMSRYTSGGTDMGALINADGTNYTFAINHLNVANGTLATEQPTALSTTHTFSIRGNLTIGAGILNLVSTNGSFANTVDINILDPTAKRYLIGNTTTSNVVTVRNIVVSSGTGLVDVVGTGSITLMGSLTQNSANRIQMVSTPVANTTLRMLFVSGTSVEINGSGTGTIILPNLSIGTSGTRLTLRRPVTITGSQTSSTSAWNTRMLGLEGGLTTNPVFNTNGQVITINGQGEIIAASLDNNTVPGNSEWIISPNGSLTLLGNIFFGKLTMRGNMTISNDLFCRSTDVDFEENTITLNTGAELRVSGVSRTRHPNGLFVSTGSASVVGGTYSDGGNGMRVDYIADQPQAITARSYSRISMSGGSKLLSGSITARDSLFCTTMVRFGTTAVNVFIQDIMMASTGTFDMTGANHNLFCRGRTHNLGTLLTSLDYTSPVTYDGGLNCNMISSPNYRNLTISSSIKTLSGPITVSGTLTLTSGTVNFGNNNLTIGVSQQQPGNLTYTAGMFVLNGTGALNRWYGISNLPTTAAGNTGFYPIFSSAGENRNVYIYFNSATALSIGGVIGISQGQETGIVALSPTFSDGGQVQQNRTRSFWTFATPIQAPEMAFGGALSVQVYGQGTCAPISNAAAQDLRLNKIGSAVGTNLPVALASTTLPIVERSSLAIADLLGTFYITGTATNLPANIWRAIANGNWSSGAVWDIGIQPASDAVVIIPAGRTVTLTANASCRAILVESGATFTTANNKVTLGAGSNTTINGTLNTANTSASPIFGTASSTFDVVTNVAPTAPVVTLGNTSTVNYNATTAQFIQPLQYNNLTISGSNRSGNVVFETTGIISVSGLFTTTATFTTGNAYQTANSSFRFNGSSPQVYAGSFNFHNLDVSCPGGMNMNGTIGVAGDLTGTTTSYREFNCSTFNFNGTGNQTIPAKSYCNLRVTNGSRTVTLASTGTILVTGTFTPTYSATYVTTGSTFDYSIGGPVVNFQYNNLVISNSGTRVLDNSTNGPGAILISGSMTLPDATFLVTTGSTVTYNGTGAQTILGGITYHNLNVINDRGAANVTIGNGNTVTAMGNLNLSFTTTGTQAFSAIALPSTTTEQNITLNNTGFLQNLIVSGSVKNLLSNVRFDGGSTITLNANVRLNGFDFIMGNTSSSLFCNFAASPTGQLIYNSTGALVRVYPNGLTLPAITAPTGANQHFNFPIANFASQTRQAYLINSTSRASTSTWSIRIAYNEGNNTQIAPNNVTVNSQLINRITRGSWRITSGSVGLTNLGLAFASFGMFNVTNSNLLRAVSGSDNVPASIAVPTGTWSGTGTFPSYLLTSTNVLGAADFNDDFYFIGSENTNFGNAYVANLPGGSWDESTTWLPLGVPDASAGVIIPSGTNVTLSQNQAADYLDVQTGGTLDLLDKQLSLGNASLHNLNGTVMTQSPCLIGCVNAAFPNRAITDFSALGAGSNIVYNSTGAQTITNITYQNLTSAGGTRTIAGTLTIKGTFSSGNSVYNTANSTVVFTSTSATVIPPCNYFNLTRTGSANTIFGTTGANGNVIGIAGVLTLGTGTLVTTGSTIEYNGVGSQTIDARTYNNLVISGNRSGGTITFPALAPIRITGAYSNTATNANYSNLNSTIDFASASTQTIAPGGYFNITNTGNGPRVLSSTGVISIAGSWQRGTGAYTIGTSTINYNGTGAQSIAGGPYFNLMLSNARGSSTVSLNPEAFSIANDFTNVASFTGSGAFSTAGSTIDFTKSTAAVIPGFSYFSISNSGNGPRTLTGTVSIAGAFSTGTGTYTTTGSTVNYNGSGAQTIAQIDYNNLTVSGARTGSPAISFGAGTTGIAGALSLTATGATYSIPSSSNVHFNGAGNQLNNPIAPSISFGNLTFSGSGTKSFSVPFSMQNNATLTLAGTAVLNNATNNLTCGNTINITRAGGSISSAPVFGSVVNLGYTTASQTVGNEWPSSASVLGSVTINVGSGQTVNLASASAPVLNNTLNLTSGALDIRPATSLTLNGTVTTGSGTLTGGSTAVLTIGGTSGGNVGTLAFTAGSNTLQDFNINRRGGTANLVLGSDLQVLNAVTFATNATTRIQTGSFTLDLGTTGQAINEAAGRYVVGRLRATRTVNNTVSPITFGNVGAALSNCTNCNLGAVVITRTAGPGVSVSANGNRSINRWWRITPTQQPTSALTLSLNWNSDDDFYASPATFAKVWRSTNLGSTWTHNKNLPPLVFANRSVSLPVTAFSDWTIATENNPLPVTFSSVAAKKIGTEQARVTWVTTAEINTHHFVVERSVNNLFFERAGTVQATGNGNTNSYVFTDVWMAAEQVYYRIRAIDFDNQETLSPTVVVKSKAGSVDFQLWPNPASQRLSLMCFSETTTYGDIIGIDAKGRHVFKQQVMLQAGNNTISLDQHLNELPTGAYRVQLAIDGKQYTQVFAKQ